MTSGAHRDDTGQPPRVEEIHALAEGKLEPERAAQVRRSLLVAPAAMRNLVDAEAMLAPVAAHELQPEASRREVATRALRMATARPAGPRAWPVAVLLAAAALATLSLWWATTPAHVPLAAPRPPQVSHARSGQSQWLNIGVQLDVLSQTPDGLIALVVSERDDGLTTSRLFPPVPAFAHRDRWLSAWRVIPPDAPELYPTRSGVLVIVARAAQEHGTVADEATIAALEARIGGAIREWQRPLQANARETLSAALRGFGVAVEVHWVAPN